MSQGNSTKHHTTNKASINDILHNMLSTNKHKTCNTNNSTQINLKNKKSLNNCLATASNKTHNNNITFANLNYKHILILQHTLEIEQQKDHQSSQQLFMKTNQLLGQIDLLNIMSRHNCHNAVFDNVMQ